MKSKDELTVKLNFLRDPKSFLEAIGAVIIYETTNVEYYRYDNIYLCYHKILKKVEISDLPDHVDAVLDIDL